MDDNSANAAQPDTTVNTGTTTQTASTVPSGDAAPASPDTTATTGNADTQSADAAAPNDDGEPGDQPRKPDRSAARRIGGLTREVRAAEREIGRLRGLMEARGLPLDDSGPRQTPASDPGEPRPEQFNTYEDYTRALARHEARQEHQRLNRATAEMTAAQRVQESIKAVRGEATDFDEVIAHVLAPDSGFPGTDTMVKYIEEAEQPGRILYWLGTHQDEADRISQLSPMGQAKELAKVEAKLATAKPPPQRTGAPPPPKTINGSGAAEKDPGKMTMEEYARHRGMA